MDLALQGTNAEKYEKKETLYPNSASSEVICGAIHRDDADYNRRLRERKKRGASSARSDSGSQNVL